MHWGQGPHWRFFYGGSTVVLLSAYHFWRGIRRHPQSRGAHVAHVAHVHLEWLLRCAVCQQTAFGPENSKPPEATVDSSGEKVFELYCINMFLTSSPAKRVGIPWAPPPDRRKVAPRRHRRHISQWRTTELSDPTATKAGSGLPFDFFGYTLGYYVGLSYASAKITATEATVLGHM